MAVVSIRPHYAEAGRVVSLSLPDGSRIKAAVALLLEYGVDRETDTAADYLLDWLQKVNTSGRASLSDLEGIAEACGVRFVVTTHPECPYPNVYLLSPTQDRMGHFVLFTYPEDFA